MAVWTLRAPRAALIALAILGPAAPVGGQTPGDIARAPLSATLEAAVTEAVRAQVLDPARAQVRPLLHFPPQRGDLGRVCGEVIEEGAQGPRQRAFYASYARTGRVLARIEDMSLADYLKQDTVFRNCGPRL
jgi:hypothetical protein